MLPTDKESDIAITNLDNELLFIKGGSFWIYSKPQHLYILSDDEIKEGDCVLWLNEKIWKEFKKTDNGWYLQWGTSQFIPIREFKKIIASTDKSIIPNSWIPDSFVEAYVKAYNEGKSITEVNLEMEEALNGGLVTTLGDHDGSVIIHRSRTFTSDQINQAIKEAIMHPELFITGICHDDTKSLEWIEANIK